MSPSPPRPDHPCLPDFTRPLISTAPSPLFYTGAFAGVFFRLGALYGAQFGPIEAGWDEFVPNIPVFSPFAELHINV